MDEFLQMLQFLSCTLGSSPFFEHKPDGRRAAIDEEDRDLKQLYKTMKLKNRLINK